MRVKLQLLTHQPPMTLHPRQRVPYQILWCVSHLEIYPCYYQLIQASPPPMMATLAIGQESILLRWESLRDDTALIDCVRSCEGTHLREVTRTCWWWRISDMFGKYAFPLSLCHKHRKNADLASWVLESIVFYRGLSHASYDLCEWWVNKVKGISISAGVADLRCVWVRRWSWYQIRAAK